MAFYHLANYRHLVIGGNMTKLSTPGERRLRITHE
jgi:hypothetical protein